MGTPSWKYKTEKRNELKAAIQETFEEWLSTTKEGGGLLGEERFSCESAWRKIMEDMLPMMTERTLSFMVEIYWYWLKKALNKTAYWAVKDEGSKDDAVGKT